MKGVGESYEALIKHECVRSYEKVSILKKSSKKKKSIASSTECYSSLDSPRGTTASGRKRKVPRPPPATLWSATKPSGDGTT